MEEQAVYKIQKHEGSRDGARKRVHAQRDTIDKGPDRKVDGYAGTCDEKVFRFRVCGADGHSYRFRVGTKRRRTRWQLDVKRRWKNVDEGGRERDSEKKWIREREYEDPRRDKPKSSTGEGAIGERRVRNHRE